MNQKEFTINAQDHIIAEILEHLENGMLGQGIARSYHVEKIDDLNLKFTFKDGAKEIKAVDWFWFGYLTPDKNLKS